MDHGRPLGDLHNRAEGEFLLPPTVAHMVGWIDSTVLSGEVLCLEVWPRHCRGDSCPPVPDPAQ